jgi:hypothetical protein
MVRSANPPRKFTNPEQRQSGWRRKINDFLFGPSSSQSDRAPSPLKTFLSPLRRTDYNRRRMLYRSVPAILLKLKIPRYSRIFDRQYRDEFSKFRRTGGGFVDILRSSPAPEIFAKSANAHGNANLHR